LRFRVSEIGGELRLTKKEGRERGEKRSNQCGRKASAEGSRPVMKKKMEAILSQRRGTEVLGKKLWGYKGYRARRQK